MIARALPLCALLAVSACQAEQGPPLVSAMSPPSTYLQSANSEPQSLSSLPQGAANLSGAPGAIAPNIASITLGGRQPATLPR